MQILDILQACQADLSRTVLAHMDLYHDNLPLLTALLERGVVLSMDCFSISSACFDPDQIFPTITQVVNCIAALLVQPQQQHGHPAFQHQIVLSAGVCMQLQYRQNGGMGFAALSDYLVPRLQAKLGAETTRCMTHTTPMRLLATWWQPPPPVQAPKEYLDCSICGRAFEPVLGEYYSKYTFVYCGSACLRKHAKMKFKALEDEKDKRN